LDREVETELIGVVATSHCRLAEEMLAAAEMIVGPCRTAKPSAPNRLSRLVN